MHWCLLLIITMYFLWICVPYLDQSHFFSKALIIRLFLVYLFTRLNKNSTTQLFILIRFKSNNNLQRKYQSGFLEPTYWLRALVTLLTTLANIDRQKSYYTQCSDKNKYHHKLFLLQLWLIRQKNHKPFAIDLIQQSSNCISPQKPAYNLRDHSCIMSAYFQTFWPPTSPLPDESINVRLKISRICHFLTTLPTPKNDYVIHGWTLTTSAELPQ